MRSAFALTCSIVWNAFASQQLGQGRLPFLRTCFRREPSLRDVRNAHVVYVRADGEVCLLRVVEELPIQP